MAVLYPLFFTFKERVSVADRLVQVTAKGRVSALQDPEDGQWWFYGVNPGALAGQGSTPNAAFADFRVAFRDVLADLASESRSVESFERQTRAFFEQVAEETEREWWDAVQLVRQGNVELPGLPRKRAEDLPEVCIVVEVAPNQSELGWSSEGWSQAA
ncbi:MAG: hypothetical protein IT186_12715 [Acidobacteria bacterium]|nr:hypothetical protein [Acidobacteriota bacterium]